MTGYNGYSKSNNAVNAESEGKYPLTRAVDIVAKSAAISKVLARTILKEIGPSEWHHSSKYYNKVDYYDTATAIKFAQSIDAIRTIQKSDFRARVTDVLKGNMDQRMTARESICGVIAAELNVTADLVRNVYYSTWEDL